MKNWNRYGAVFFYGSCGYLDRRGNLDLNILIRTLLVGHPEHDNPSALVWGQVGAGIVADSDPRREWLESLQKAKSPTVSPGVNGCSLMALLRPFQGSEHSFSGCTV